ncbi:unnamed protein product [Rotaria socialis]|uniref:PDZ domain-containing protein n=1 Tax=Rotaria socialis TaxID=392032 RepID=A0A818EJL9_9BILA|nr:unnamed protein product [Rotaria socialis]CAF3346399.1 unnamed protein product [Rotaria socialis]CAF3459940.1 unnamed protein product [Rotaria socialis]CAF3464404.1 unnamed protein product [Rotaria socialis]CAF3640008.1 unnamed protein product [Rotaria socialis]
MHDRHQSYPIEVLFEDHVTLSDGRSKPHLVLLQLTSETLIIRRLKITQVSSINDKQVQTIIPRNVTLKRHPTTHSFGFSIKGGSDTGFPVLISRVVYTNAHLLHVGDAILSINNENISTLTHDEVIQKLRDTSGDQVNLIVKYMNDMAPYLSSASATARSSFSSLMPMTQTSYTLPTSHSVRLRRQQNRMSAEYPSRYHRPGKQQQRLSLMLSDERKDTDEYELLSRLLLCENENERCRHQLETFAKEQKQQTDSIATLVDEDDEDSSTVDYVSVHEYSLLYAYVTQYITGTDKLRTNSFQLHTLDGSQSGIIISDTSAQQHLWISRINTIIHNLTARTITELNQSLLSSEQVLYATWMHERVTNINQNRLPEWKPIFIVMKGSDLYIFDDNKPPPICSYDFICCSRIYPIVEILIEVTSSKYLQDDRQYCLTLTVSNDLIANCRYFNFETKNGLDEFLSNWQRSLYMSVYAVKNRAFGCIYQGQICRLVIDINNGFEMYNNETNVMLWSFTFEQLQSSSDNGRDKIYFEFKRSPLPNESESTIKIEVQCQHLRILIHVINAFLTIKLIGKRDNTID